MTGLGGPIVDGTYVMTVWHVWASGCGGVQNQPTRATLDIHGGKMDLVYTGLHDFGGSPATTTRASFTYTLVGTVISAHELCPTNESPTELAYTSQGDTLIISKLPGMFDLAPNMATFKRQ
jgi:hypothetical protein